MKQPFRRSTTWMAIWFGAFFATNAAFAADYTLNKIVGGLNQPTIAAFAPDDDNDIYIAELKGANVGTLGGIVKYNRTTQTKTTVINNLGTVSTGDGGVVGLTFNPNFTNNGLFYIAYNKSDGSTFNNYLVEYHMNPDGTAAPSSRASNTGLVYKYSQLNPINYHSIDWIGFDPTASGDGQNYLYVTTGDGGPLIDDTSASGFAKNATLLGTDVGKPYTQSPLNPYGKILRLNVDPNAADAYPADANKNFAIPAGNPLAGVGGGVLPEVVAAGFKNPFRGNFDRATGDFYVGDVGNTGREEIDFIKAGTMGTPTTAFDFGWPTKEGMLDPPAGVTVGAANDYSDQDLATPMINPIQEHHHLGDGSVPANMQANAIIGGVVYHRPITSLQGKYIYGDYVTDHIYVSNFDRNMSPGTFNGANLTNLQEVSGSWESLVQGNPAGKDLEFPTSLTEDNQGNLYVVSFGNSPNDSLNGGSVRQAGGLGIGELYELVYAPILGDYNHNGVVDAADYTIWRDSYGQVASNLPADGDGDGMIGPGDYDKWVLNFGHVASVTGSGASVPEPPTLVLALLLAALTLGRRRAR